MSAALVQRTPEWVAARVGSLGASCVHEVVARTKTGFAASRANRLAALVVERLTGQPEETFQSAAMLHGIETEAEARAAYEFMNDAQVTEVGLIRHPRIERSHASPDGLIGDDGVLELKCPQPAAHLEFLLTGKVPEKYVTQMMWQLACGGRQWADFASYSPVFPPEMRLATKRLQRDDAKIAELEKAVVEFLIEVDAKVEGLRRLYGLPEPGPATPPEEPREKIKWSDRPASCQIALACKNKRFRQFLAERTPANIALDEATAEDEVKFLCGVKRKRDITPGSPAFAKWAEIYGTFEAERDYGSAAA
jgi:putative phage-type endonuclease